MHERLIGTAAAILLCADVAQPQRIGGLNAGVEPGHAPVVAMMETSAGTKSPALAGVLSAWIPGVGSFYAGNNKHGVIHFAVNGVGWSAIAVGAGVPDNCSKSCSGAYAAAAVAGLVIVPVNWVWSVFTAVDDAKTHNRAASGAPQPVVGSLTVSLDVRVLGVEQTGMTRQVGAQIVTWRF